MYIFFVLPEYKSGKITYRLDTTFKSGSKVKDRVEQLETCLVQFDEITDFY